MPDQMCSTEDRAMDLDDIFEELRKSWSSPFVARSEVAKFSGGLLHPRTMANIDCDKEEDGPPRVIFGMRGVAYERDGLVDWMRRRAYRPRRK